MPAQHFSSQRHQISAAASLLPGHRRRSEVCNNERPPKQPFQQGHNRRLGFDDAQGMDGTLFRQFRIVSGRSNIGELIRGQH